MMLCEDVRNIIHEFAADRNFYDLWNDFADEIELLIDQKHEKCEEIYKSSYVDDILQDVLAEFGVTQSELELWTTDNMYELKFMILRKMPDEMSQKHYAYLSQKISGF